MKKIFHLSTCNTCKRIIDSLQLPGDFEVQDIKSQPLTVKQLDALHARAGSYEALFSKRAKLYQERDLKNEKLSEDDYKLLLLEHYTFLKRPVLVIGDNIYIGNAKSEVEKAKKAVEELD